MSAKVRRRCVWGARAVVLLVLALLLSWDSNNTVARKLQEIGLYGIPDGTWEVIEGKSSPVLLDPIDPPAPQQNSIVGVCQSTDPDLGGLAAPLTDTLTYAQVDSITRLTVIRAGGLETVVNPGDWVVIKPNILNFYQSYIFGYPDIIVQGTAADLRVVKSLIQQLVEEGDASRITISEGGDWHNLNNLPPALQGIQTEDGWTVHWPHYGGLSYVDMVADFDTLYPGIVFDIVDMNYPPYSERPVPGGGLMADTYTLPDVLDCDVLIPVASMKTHFISRITCMHKHFVGVTPATVYGTGAPPFNMNHGLLPHGDNIERVIIDLLSYHPPDFGLVECFWGMEGYGPHAGIPIKRNVVLASGDPVALDAIDAYVMGMNPWDIDHLHWSHNKGFGTYDLDYITVNGPALDDVRYEFVKAPRGPGYYLGRGNRIWLVNGTYDGSTDLDAEQLGAGVEASISPVPGQMTQGNPWTVAQFTRVDEYCDLSAYFGGPANCVSYAFTRIVADTAQMAYLRFGGNDGMKVWLNGAVVYNQAAVGGSDDWDKVEDGVAINLLAGVNRLLLKISNASGGYGFSLITTESDTDGDTPLGIEYRVTALPAPEVVLHMPLDGSTTAQSYADLQASVTDGDSDSLSVEFYGGVTPAAGDLLHLAEGVASGTHISWTWDALVLQTTPDTRGLWHLNENTGTTVADFSGYGNTGTITGATWTAAGKFGPALSFSGSPGDYLDVGNDASLNPTFEITFEAWINVNQVSGSGPKVYIRDSCSAMRVRGDGGINWELARSGTPYTEVYATTPPGSVPLGEWVYVAGTCDSNGVMNAYVNGEFLGTNNLGGALRTASTNLYIGWWPDYHMDGVIDEVRLSDRALTETEIQANYALGNGTYYWRVIATDGETTDTSETRSFIAAVEADTQPPEITLNAPPNGDLLPAGSSASLDVTVTDPEGSPVEVWLYGDTSATPTNLLYHGTDLASPADILYTWGAGAELPVASSTVALWHFNENSGTTAGDETGSHDGVVTNATWAPGRFGPGLTFGGDDRVEIPDSPDWNTPELTVQAWVNASAFTSTYNCIVTKGSYPSAVDLGYALLTYDAQLTFLIGNADGSNWAVLRDAMGGTTLATDTWYYVAVTYDGSEVRLYVNGDLDSNGTANPYAFTDGLHYAVGPVDIGSSLQQATSDTWIGLIDEVRISNVALTESEIRATFALEAGRYYWYAEASDTVLNSASSVTRYFDVEQPVLPLDVPTLVNPPDLTLTDDNTPTFDWTATAGPGGSYALELALDAGFTTGVVTVTGLTDTSYTVPGGEALMDDTYYWHVEAFDAASNGSGYQATPFSFTVDTQPPEVPALINPPNVALITDATPTLDWSATAGAGGLYTLEYALDAGFTTGVVTVTGLTDTSYTVPGGEALTDDTCYWHVQAIDAASNASGYQATPHSFTVDTQAPEVPALINPPDLAVTGDATPMFVWSATAGGGGIYTLEYALDAGFTTGVQTITGITDTTYAEAGALADDTYYWHVQAIDAASNASGYQATTFSFTVDTQPPEMPTLISPPDQAVLDDATPHFEWSATAGIGGTYTLECGSDSDFIFALTVSGLTDTTYEVQTPFMDGDYYWHVKAMDQAGNESGFQGIPFGFTLVTGAPAMPILLTPTDSSFTCDTTPTFTWEGGNAVLAGGEDPVGGRQAAGAGSAASTYTLQYSPDPTFAQATTVAGLAYSTYTVLDTAPLRRGLHYWRVEAVDEADHHSGYQPHPFRFGVFVAGDQNDDGVITAADVIYLVNYTFKGGNPPVPCAAAGDANCDGAVTAGDVIYLVNHTFKGGPVPCDVGALITAGTWTCPW